MANKKISALTAATTPDGTELVPIVQGGTTKKATVSQLTGATAATLPATGTQSGSTAAGTPFTPIDITTAVAGKGKWRFVLGGANFGGVEDPVLYFGYNVANGQTAVLATEPVLSFNMEAQYNDSGVDTSEQYSSFTDTTGTRTARAFMFQFRRTPVRVVTDGVLNSTTTITSATAAFIASDAGALIAGTGIPAGTTIAAYVSATQVTLSAAATATASGVTLTISNMNTMIRQSIFRGNPVLFQLPDNTNIGSIADGTITAFAGLVTDAALTAQSNGGVPQLILKDGSTTRFSIVGANNTTVSMSVGGTQMLQMAKSASLQQFVFGSAVAWGIFTIDAAGTSGANNPILTTRSRASVVAGQDHYVAITSGNALLSRIDRNGYFMTSKSAAPADADISTGELAWWFDKTNGAGKAMFKGKTADGTVVTGSVALA